MLHARRVQKKIWCIKIYFVYVCVCVCAGRGQSEDTTLAAVVCHTPLSNLGHCRKGSTLSFSVAFQILKPGLYEVGRVRSSDTSRPRCLFMYSVCDMDISNHYEMCFFFCK